MNRVVRLSVPVLFLLAACGHEVILRPAVQPQVELLGDAYQAGQVRAAVVRALASRKFVAEGEEPGKVVARFERDGKQARLAVEYSPTQFAIRFLASANMSESKDPAGNVLVDSTYFDWTNRLDRSIQEELKRIHKDAAAAAKADREYELMLQRASSGQSSSGAGDVAGAVLPGLLNAVPRTNINVESKTTTVKH